MKPLLGIPDELAVLDIMCFGRAAKPPYKRAKKALDEIVNWERFDPAHRMTTAQIEDWIANRRHRLMYRDASNRLTAAASTARARCRRASQPTRIRHKEGDGQ